MYLVILLCNLILLCCQHLASASDDQDSSEEEEFNEADDMKEQDPAGADAAGDSAKVFAYNVTVVCKVSHL